MRTTRILLAAIVTVAASGVAMRVTRSQPVECGRGRDATASTTQDDGLCHTQLVASTPLTAVNGTLRPERLIDMQVESVQGERLGKIHDAVVSPETGRIVYLVIGRDRGPKLFEITTPVPWMAFGLAGADGPSELLVLNTTLAILDDAPTASVERFLTKDDYARQKKIVDAYWLQNLPACTPPTHGGGRTK